ncbi:MAG: hypothetical protein WC238_03375 [Parcubacteria group bacterium]|jgi:photosystem II stability/assembly factor-like uncharacterized protein
MRKYLFLAVLILAPMVLAGCSLTPAAPANTPPPPPNPNNSLWTSTDAGKTWINNFPLNQKVDISKVDVLSLAVNPFDAKNVFVGLKGAGILKTDNGGQDWSYLNFQSEKVYGLDIDPKDGRIIYASGVWQKRGKIFKSTDSGENWVEIYTTPANGPLVISLVIDKRSPNIIYATTSDNQVIKSTDTGVSWKNIYTSSSPVLKVAIDRLDSNLIYMATQSGIIFRSKDGGKKFEDLSSQSQRDKKSQNIREVTVIETDPSNSGWLYAVGRAGMLKSSDAGKTWSKIEILNNPQNFPVKTLAVNPANSKELIYGAAQAAYRSVDGGVNWSTFQFDLAKNVNVIKYSNLDPTQLYLGFSK